MKILINVVKLFRPNIRPGAEDGEPSIFGYPSGPGSLMTSPACVLLVCEAAVQDGCWHQRGGRRAVHSVAGKNGIKVRRFTMVDVRM